MPGEVEVVDSWAEEGRASEEAARVRAVGAKAAGWAADWAVAAVGAEEEVEEATEVEDSGNLGEGLGEEEREGVKEEEDPGRSRCSPHPRRCRI